MQRDNALGRAGASAGEVSGLEGSDPVVSGSRGRTPRGRPEDGHVLIATMLRRSGTVGVQTHVTQVVELLRGQGQHVRVVSPGRSFPVVGPALLVPGRVARRVRNEVGVRAERSWNRHVLQLALMREFRNVRPSAIYAQDPRSAHAALTVRGSEDIPVVVMAVHYNESQAQELAEQGLIAFDGTTDRSIRAFEADLLPRLDGLVFVSNFMREHLHDTVPATRGVPSIVVPNFLGPLVPDLERRAVMPLRDCITVGNLVERKNHRYLLEVLAATRRLEHRYTLTVVGNGPNREALERQARLLGVADQVLFTGARRDVDRLLARHRLYVHSATMENLPFALLEAFRGGLPVIAGRVGGIPEVIGPELAGRYWDLSDPEEGARVLETLLEDPATMRVVSCHALARFEQEFSAGAAGSALVDFLSSPPR